MTAILSLAFLSGVFLLWRYLPEGSVRRVISGRTLSVVLIAAMSVMTAVEGTWGTALHRNPAFWAVALLMMLSLGFDVLDCLRRKSGFVRTVSHTGMFLLVFGAFWGAPDFVDVQMVVGKEHAENLAYSRGGDAVFLPFGVALEEFKTDYYEDGVSPKQYRSTLLIEGRRLETGVNHPCRYKGYRIYQADFDHEAGEYSILKLVRDPWLPLVFIGMALLAAGALAGLGLNWNSRYLTLAFVIAAVIFAVISVARINFGTLMPALRSLWFIPHLALYMLAYSALALALVTGILPVFGVRGGRLVPLSGKLSGSASSLLLIGMLCGAVWAKVAWGDWWTWDSKECWAAVTWMLTLAGSHLPEMMRGRRTAVLICILLAFLAMQVAWYGVDYLPAAQSSMHAYR